MRPKTLPALKPSAALQAEYDRRLQALIAEMANSVVYWLTAQYRSDTPELASDAENWGTDQADLGAGRSEGGRVFLRRDGDARRLAVDASPAAALRDELRRLGRRWQRKFDRLAPQLARYFATKASERVDAHMRSALRKNGMSVEFRMTREQNDVVQAAVAENVALIKSIPQQYLTQVEGVVMRSVQTGRDLKTLHDGLTHQLGVTKRRARMISLDQNNKATASLHRARQIELGLEAIWLHSAGGKVPRRTHVAQSGKRYDPKTGWYDPDAKQWCWPGTLISCRCVSKTVVPGF